MKALSKILVAVWFLGAVDANAQLSVFSQAGLEYKRFTWHAETKTDGQTADLLLTTIKIQSGEILFPVAMEYENMSIKAVISYPDGTKLTYSRAPQKSDWLDVVGPASVDLKTTLHTYANFSYALVFNYLIKKADSSNSSSSLPSNTVVIPTDASGPVEIVMESSKDLVNWTRAEPGTYGTDTPKRFFRIRAVVKP
jgi:hypothetical protein